MKLSETFDKLTEDYIRKKGFIRPDWQIYDYQKAGEGNMNFVVRVFSDHGNIIVKQSRPYVNKYPQIAAPINRILVEKAFYETINSNQVLKSYSPRILGFDPINYSLAMEDLGFGSDFMGIYAHHEILSKNDINDLVIYLNQLHRLEIPTFPDNSEMKALNHEHIFIFPFLKENGFDLDTVQEGLQTWSMKYKINDELRQAAIDLGEQYLQSGPILLHGDFYPGSWLKLDSGQLKIIDPEFAFKGDAEFDLGVMLAHLYLSDVDQKLIQTCKELYQSYRSIDELLLNKYMGIEILRRLIGIAQLPMSKDLKLKNRLAEMAKSLVLKGQPTDSN
ncbi:MAG: phosphotransferase [Saprospiraceae bacterium]